MTCRRRDFISWVQALGTTFWGFAVSANGNFFFLRVDGQLADPFSTNSQVELNLKGIVDVSCVTLFFILFYFWVIIRNVEVAADAHAQGAGAPVPALRGEGALAELHPRSQRHRSTLCPQI